MSAGVIGSELRRHAPYTALGTATGLLIMMAVIVLRVPRDISTTVFWTLHPLHVLLSALVTAAIYRRHAGSKWYSILAVGYVGSIGIATLSDAIIPFVGEWLLQLPNRGVHVGFIEKWWLVNPLALVGIVWGALRPFTRFAHAGHVLLSTWASLFHIIMALGTQLDAATVILVPVFLFLAVWLPCCTSDIVFPLLWVSRDREPAGGSA